MIITRGLSALSSGVRDRSQWLRSAKSKLVLLAAVFIVFNLFLTYNTISEHQEEQGKEEIARLNVESKDQLNIKASSLDPTSREAVVHENNQKQVEQQQSPTQLLSQPEQKQEQQQQPPPPPPPPPTQQQSAKRSCIPPTERDLTKFPILLYERGEIRDLGPCVEAPFKFTNNIDEADAVILELASSVPPVSARPCPHQKYVFFSLESAAYYSQVTNAKTNGFDYTMDYRLDEADVPLVYFSKNNFKLRRPPKYSFAEKLARNDTIISAFISNCNALNGRNEMLGELVKLLGLHSYGSCHHNRNPDSALSGLHPWDQKRKTVSQYLFTLSPENSNAKSYVTEKLYQVLETGSVPVYMGAPDIDRFIPSPKSVIMASDFANTTELAKYLQYLATNETAYNEYLAYKTDPKISDGFKELLRLSVKDDHCRLSMLMAGKPYKWRNAEKGVVDVDLD